jgi:hypothetical protein
MVTVKEDSRYAAERAKEYARYEAERISQDPELQQEWIRQFNWSYAGLLGIGALMVQPFLTADSLDVSATISVVAFSVAIPLLAGLVMVSWQESFRRRMTGSRIVTATRPVAQLAAFVGLVAGFWHIDWIAGVGLLVSTLVAMGVHSAGLSVLELNVKPTPEEAEKPASPEPEDPAPQQADEPGERAKESGDTES